MGQLNALIRAAAVPLILLVLFLIFLGLYQILGLPSADELIQIAKRYYSEYGYWVIFLGALTEGILVINWYLPGSFVIVMGVLLSRHSNLNIAVLIALVILAFFMTTILNYLMGRYGWYRLLLKLGLGPPLERMRHRAIRHGLSIVFSTYFHPNVGALAATSCGILRFPFISFLKYSALALIGWNLLWGVLVYISGPTIMKFLSMWLLIPLLALWALILIVRSFRQTSKKEKEI